VSRKPRERRNIPCANASVQKALCRAARGVNFEALGLEPLAQLNQAGFVVDRDQGSPSTLALSASSCRCSWRFTHIHRPPLVPRPGLAAFGGSYKFSPGALRLAR
jgi:hypothetical protein